MRRLFFCLLFLSSALAFASSDIPEMIAKEIQPAPEKPIGAVTVHHGQMFSLPWGWQVTDADSGCVIHYASVLFVPGSGFFPCFLYSIHDSPSKQSCGYGYYPGMPVQQANPTPGTSFPGCVTTLFFQRLSAGQNQPHMVSGYFVDPLVPSKR